MVSKLPRAAGVPRDLNEARPRLKSLFENLTNRNIDTQRSEPGPQQGSAKRSSGSADSKPPIKQVHRPAAACGGKGNGDKRRPRNSKPPALLARTLHCQRQAS